MRGLRVKQDMGGPADLSIICKALYRAKKLAKRSGLDLHHAIDSERSPTARSQEIKHAASPATADASANIRASRQTFKVRQPNGLEIEATRTQIEINAWLALEKAVMALTSLLTRPFKWSGRAALRFGKWLRVTTGASSDESEC